MAGEGGDPRGDSWPLLPAGWREGLEQALCFPSCFAAAFCPQLLSAARFVFHSAFAGTLSRGIVRPSENAFPEKWSPGPWGGSVSRRLLKLGSWGLGAVRAEGRGCICKQDIPDGQGRALWVPMSDPSWKCVGAVVCEVRTHVAAALTPGERLWEGQGSSLYLRFIPLSRRVCTVPR